MSNALMSGVTGLQAHQKMLDVAGNNLSNVNTYGFKASRITFAEQLAETMREATQPTAASGGTNPQQIGAGVTIASVDRDMNPGNLVATGQSLDMAIDGSGYFVLNDGEKDVYTRVGNFAVDAEYRLVDPGTGNRVQRIGNEGVTEGFQDPTSDSIRIPYDVALPARATEDITFAGNLSADSVSTTTNLLTSGVQYTVGGAVADADTLLADLDQMSAGIDGETITVSGTNPDGTAIGANVLAIDAATTTLGDLRDVITTAVTGATASLNNGEVRVADDNAGYSLTDLALAYSGTASDCDLPDYWQILSAGGEEVKNTNVEVFDSLGISHVMSVAFVRTDTANQWDAVLTGITGDNISTDLAGRRVRGINFNSDGSYAGLDSGLGDTADFEVAFGDTGGATSTIGLDLGTAGQFDGLSQFGGSSTVAASGQDGYEAGYLSSLSVSREGVLVGMFTNGVRQDIAALKVATFQNPAGLQSAGNGYFVASANSGDPVPTKALAGGAGAVVGGSLEKSNVEVAKEFVNLIQAQNGFQANARTIRVTNDMLMELSNLIR